MVFRRAWGRVRVVPAPVRQDPVLAECSAGARSGENHHREDETRTQPHRVAREFFSATTATAAFYPVTLRCLSVDPRPPPGNMIFIFGKFFLKKSKYFFHPIFFFTCASFGISRHHSYHSEHSKYFSRKTVFFGPKFSSPC